MMSATPVPSASKLLDLAGLDRLIALLRRQGRQVIAPRLGDGAIILAPIEGVADLPAGHGAVQRPGQYRLVPRADGALFGHGPTAQSWKPFLHPPRQRLMRLRRVAGGFTCDPPQEPPPPPLALLGVRACELAALAVLDRALDRHGRGDPGYRNRRRDCLIIAVQCGEAGGDCFCASLGTGPRVGAGADIVLHELIAEGAPRFVARADSADGHALLAALDPPDCPAADLAAIEVALQVAGRQSRHLDVAAARMLQARPEHPRWQQVAERCLACGNCTLVCPTCFCTTVSDVTDLTGTQAERWRQWDNCFSLDFSYVHGGPVRTEIRSRYRQWLTHKLSVWHDQFGSSGCVGCGRCITWCPVGIDLTEEVAAITADGGRPETADGGRGRPA